MYGVEFFESFTLPVRRVGKTCLLLAIIFSFIPPAYVAIRYNCMPPFSMIASGYVLIFSTQFTFYLTENISYYQVFGEGGCYMSFLAGSASGIRLPATLGAQDALGCEPGSNKAEVVACIAIAASVCCSTIMNFIGVTTGSILLAVLPDQITGMFDYVLPAVVGALFLPRVKREPRVGVIGIALAIFLRKTSIIDSHFKMILNVALCIAIGLWLAKMDKAKSEKTSGEA